MPRVKFISVGDEILIGQIVNTNAAYLGEKFFAAGMPAEMTVVIGDNENALLLEFEDSLSRYDITVITGGLGPTHDDITKPALVKFFNDTLVTNEEVLAHVKNFFASRKIPMPVVNEGQALVPENSDMIRNENGTAPGIWIEKNGKVFVALPGVPYEMKPMIEEQVIPRLLRMYSAAGRSFLQKTLLTTGIGESSLYEMFGDMHKLLDGNKLAFLPSATGVRLRMNVEAASIEAAQKIMEDFEKRIRAVSDEFIYGENDETLEMILGRLLRKSKKTISVAESCTGGKISSRIVNVAGSSDYYLGGVCSYSNDSKMSVLGVSRESLSSFGAVSSQVAVEMADGARRLFGTDYSISTTGIAGPAGATDKKPVGLVWIGFSSEQKSYAIDFNFGNNRMVNIERAAQRALEIVRRELLNLKIRF